MQLATPGNGAMNAHGFCLPVQRLNTVTASGGGDAVPAASIYSGVVASPAEDVSGEAKKKKTGKRATRVAAKKSTAILDWSDVMVRDLMSLWYETYAERFGKAKNNSALKEAWLLLATELSHNQKTAISSEQCKNKLKWLKRKWAEFNADVHATGNSETEVVEPPGLDLMQEFWSSSSGMNVRTLADNEEDAAALSDEDAGSDAEQTTSQHVSKQKKRKTMGDSFEIGMQSIAEGFQAMAAAMVPSPTTANAPGEQVVVDLIDTRFAAMMHRQDERLEQMKLQNQQLAALIGVLKHGGSN